MKTITKFTLKTLRLFLAIITCTTALYTQGMSFAKINKKIQNNKKTIQFTPDNKFGGVDAQGEYTKKSSTANITYDQTTYTFDKVDEAPNPILHKNKLNLVPLGFFTSHTNSKDMPVTTYIFGSPINDNAQKVVGNDIKTQADQLQTNNSSTDALQFTPSKDFAGHDLIGSYDSTTQTATIHDPSGQNTKSYSFENVQPGLPISITSNNVRPLQKPILIGSYSSRPACSNGTPQVCSNVVMRTDLYGNLKA